MASYVALLRAINVSGRGTLLMQQLRALCVRAGLDAVRTHLQSGNVVFRSAEPATRVKARLEAALAKKLGRPTQVVLRTPMGLARAIAANPYPDAPPARLLILFLGARPSAADAARLATWPIPGAERFTLLGRELFLHFPEGQGASRLRVPFAELGTARNLNTVRALLALARGRA